MKGNKHYDDVWAEDRLSATHTRHSVESVASVYQRTSSFCQQLRQHNDVEVAILVGHGDALQILQTWFEGVDPTQHRSLTHLNNGEVREMTLGSLMSNSKSAL